jgi:hypothetical protein
MSRQPLDFYATPAPVIDAILPHLPLGGRILEPAAGDGAILRRLVARGISVTNISAIELDEGRANQAREVLWTECADALAVDWVRADLCLTNPPFTLGLQFAQKAIAHVASHGGTVAMLLRLTFLESRERAAFHRANPSDVYVLPSRPKYVGGGTDTVTSAWFVWGPGRGGRWSILDVPEGAK